MKRIVKERIEELITPCKANSLSVVIYELEILSNHWGATEEEKKKIYEIKVNLENELKKIKKLN